MATPRFHVIACTGDAHSNPYIDNCGQCAPLWGELVVPISCATVADWQAHHAAHADEERKAERVQRTRFINKLQRTRRAEEMARWDARLRPISRGPSDVIGEWADAVNRTK